MRAAFTKSGISSANLFSRLTLRKALTVLQFAISLVFIIVVATMWRQLDFATQANYGFNQENIVNVQLGTVDYRILAAELARDHRVERSRSTPRSVGA